MSNAFNTQLMFSFSLTVLLILAVPGPSVVFIVGRALSVGRPAALAAAAGNSVGSTLQGLLAALGLGTLVGGSPVLYNAIKFGGALYLLVMGVKMLRDRSIATDFDGSAAVGDRRDEAKKGFVVGLTNPKMIVFFTALLPQFVDPSRGNVMVQMLLLVAIYGVLSLMGDTSWGFAGGSIRTWSATSPRRLECLIGGGGACIMAIAVSLAMSH